MGPALVPGQRVDPSTTTYSTVRSFSLNRGALSRIASVSGVVLSTCGVSSSIARRSALLVSPWRMAWRTPESGRRLRLPRTASRRHLRRDPIERRFEVPLDVVRERLQRGDVQTVDRSSPAFGPIAREEVVEDRGEGGERLPVPSARRRGSSSRRRRGIALAAVA